MYAPADGGTALLWPHPPHAPAAPSPPPAELVTKALEVLDGALEAAIAPQVREERFDLDNDEDDLAAVASASQRAKRWQARLAAQLEGFANSAATQGRVSARVGVGTAAAMTALANGDPGAAVDALLPIRYDIWCMGGSHAQRDLFEEMLVDAVIHAGRHDLGRALLAERTALKPASAWSWRRYGEALAAAGDSKAAAARARADRLVAAA